MVSSFLGPCMGPHPSPKRPSVRPPPRSKPAARRHGPLTVCEAWSAERHNKAISTGVDLRARVEKSTCRPKKRRHNRGRTPVAQGGAAEGAVAARLVGQRRAAAFRRVTLRAESRRRDPPSHATATKVLQSSSHASLSTRTPGRARCTLKGRLRTVLACPARDGMRCWSPSPACPGQKKSNYPGTSLSLARDCASHCAEALGGQGSCGACMRPGWCAWLRSQIPGFMAMMGEASRRGARAPSGGG